jgi:O-antigen biosynthesis protein
MPKVSVCLIHHNEPRWLRQALASLEAQDSKDWEVVLVDDGSNQSEALKLLDEWAPRFERRGWQLLRQEHYTLGPSRNNAARHAHGDYLLFMDADNYAKPLELSTLTRIARRTQADILTPFMDWIDQDAEPQATTTPILRWPFLGAAASVGVFHNCFGDGNALIRRDVFLAVGGFSNEYQVSPDWEFLAKAVMMGFKLEPVPEALFFYRRVKTSQLPPIQQQLDLLRNVRPYAPFLPPGLREAMAFAQGCQIHAAQRAEKGTESLGESEAAPGDLDKTLGHVSRPPAFVDFLIRRLGSRKTRRYLRKKLSALHYWLSDSPR